jgi:RAD51-like protein 2
MNDRGTNLKLINLPLRPSTLALLTRRGFHTSADVLHSKKSGIANLAAELEIGLAEAASIGVEVESALKSISCVGESSIQSTNPMKTNNVPQTAASILSASIKNANYRPIISFVRSIDSLLGGGFQPHEVTEIAGMPGTGKTQLAMQLCVDAKLPKQFGGVDGDSIYIDSEGSFSPERCHDMAVSLVDHLHASSKKSNGQKVVPSNFTPDAILDSIHIFRVYDEASQTATIMALPDFLERKKTEGRQIKLLVVDSIAFHYRVRFFN